MANLNPMVPGDVPYPQYSVTTTMDIKVGQTIDKGKLYSQEGSPVGLEEPATFLGGLFQAKASVTTPAVAGDKVQVLTPRSRMLLRDSAGDLYIGRHVHGVVGTDRAIRGDPGDTLYIGRVFEIYTRNVDGTKKTNSAVGDFVVVETVGA